MILDFGAIFDLDGIRMVSNNNVTSLEAKTKKKKHTDSNNYSSAKKELLSSVNRKSDRSKPTNLSNKATGQESL